MNQIIRNSVCCGIIVPQYVHLNVYYSPVDANYAFLTRVTFGIKPDMVAALQRVADAFNMQHNSDTFMQVVQGGKRAKVQWYVAIERHYKDLNKIYYAANIIADNDRRFLKVEMRQAKIHALTKEIEDINNSIY